MNVYVVMKNKIAELKSTIDDLEVKFDICKESHLEALKKLQEAYQKCDGLEADLEACEAANAHLLAESRIKSAPGYQAGKWRQRETRRL